MKSFLKILVAVLILGAGIFSVSYLQFRFDRSDVQHAVDALRLTRTQGSNDGTIEEKLAQKYQVDPSKIQWVSQIESKVQGTVLVEALIPQQAARYEWIVDLVRFQVSPKSAEAIQLGQEKLK